uniref:Uncharacterized protein n=1 Tax=Anguilla anguilla TaxID=7936 RepID=A0A0E9XN47_ANGAN
MYNKHVALMYIFLKYKDMRQLKYICAELCSSVSEAGLATQQLQV